MDPISSFGYWLRRRRKGLDLTQEELARRVGCATETIKKIEADERRPSRQMAERLADCLELPTSDRAAFLQVARAEIAVDRLASPPATPLSSPPARGPRDRPTPAPALRGYTLREQLGAGGFGAVYHAVQPGVGREVAVKIIRPEYADHPDFIRRFEAEAQLVARLEHPHIVPLYDYWRESGGAYLVLRYIRGGSLQVALRDGPWSLEKSTRLLDQIGAALAFAHRHGVIHRDLKPANILLDDDGNAYLADFGIAKDLRLADAVGQTQPGAIVGSPEYLSPEQIKDEPITPQTDIYSLGVLLHEMLTGVQPFADLSPSERLDKQLHTPLPPLQTFRLDLPVALNDIIQRATAKAPAERYPEVVSLVVAWQQAVVSHQEGARSSVVSGLSKEDEAQRTPDNGHQTADAMTLTDLSVLENPYKGLRAFGEVDAADFFGRAGLTQQLLERLAAEGADARFLAVVGPSGSGKSSVVRAGLVPALRRGGLPGSEHWFIIEMFPGAHPLEELEAALLRVAVNPPPSLLEQLQADQRGLARAVKRVLPEDAETELVLIIDQFEELFTLTEDEAVRAFILQSLRAAVLDPRSRLRLIVTLRADFTDRPLQYVEFGELLRERTAFVLPLASEELEQAIVGPAARVGIIPTPELVAAVVKDVGEQPGTLPLLQYALTELFERREGRTLTLAAYRESGGVRGALARRADEVYTALDAGGQAAACQLFLRLITLGEGVEDTRRRTPRAELERLTNDQRPMTNQAADSDRWSLVVGRSSAMDVVIDRYGRARLLSFDHDPITRGPTVEVAHEALLREWSRLRAWLEASRADVRMQRLLGAAAAEWNNGSCDVSYLLSGARLAQFEGWAAQTEVALTQGERAFLEASLAERAEHEAAERARQLRELETAKKLAETEARRAAENAQAARRLRRLAVGLAVFLLASLGLALFAFNQRNSAQDSFVRAERIRLAAQAQIALDNGEGGDLPALLAMRSLRHGYSPEADAALLNALTRGFARQRYLGHTDMLWDLDFSPDGRYIATASNDGTGRLWDVQTGQELRRFAPPVRIVNAIDFSPDGRYLLTGSPGPAARLWDVQTGQEVRQFLGHNGGAWSMDFSPDGQHAVTADDRMAWLWDVQTGRLLRQFAGHTEPIVWVYFSPDGRSIATAGTDKTARLWDVATGREVRQFSTDTAVNAVAFSPDGRSLLTTSGDIAQLWDIQTGQELRQFVGHTDFVVEGNFSPDGRYVLTGSNDKTARLWDVATGQELRRFVGHTSGVSPVIFSPDGRYVLTGSGDRTARLWEIWPETEPRQVSTLGAQTAATSSSVPTALSPDGQYLLIVYDPKGVAVWNTQTFDWRYLKPNTTTGVNTLPAYAFSPDNRYLLAGGTDGIVWLWDAQTGQELHQLLGHSGPVRSVIFSPDGHFILSGSDDKTARLWDAQTGQELHQLLGHSGPVRSGVFSPDGRFILTGGDDQIARLWDAQTGRELHQLLGHSGPVRSGVFSPDGRYVLTGSDDKTARLWDAQTGQEVRQFVGHTDQISNLAFSPDGRYVLTGSADQTARLWDAQSGQRVRQFVGHLSGVLYLGFSPDGRSILTGDTQNIYRWRTTLEEVIALTCTQLTRDFTDDERALYNITDNAPSCPKP